MSYSEEYKEHIEYAFAAFVKLFPVTPPCPLIEI